MKFKAQSLALCAALALTVPVALADAATSTGTGGPRSSLTLVVPASAGGGYDLLAREAQQALRANAISGNVQVVNIPGAANTVGLQAVADMGGREDVLIIVGSAMIGGIEVTSSKVNFGDITPVRSMTTDYPIVVLPTNSPYANAQEFVEAWKNDPKGTPIAGGSLGNTDHLAILALAESQGIPVDEVNYISYSGGGEVLGSMLSGTVAAGVSGYSEMSDQIDAGTVRGIGLASPERLEGIDVPTFREQGLDTVTTNWRGAAAPPGLEDDEINELNLILEELTQTTEWQDAVQRNQWQEFSLTGQEFRNFIDSEVDNTRTLLDKGQQ